MELDKITETISGLEIKNLRYIAVDNIIVGHVKCPIFGKATLFEGYVTIQWNKNGFPIRKYKGFEDYKINLEIQK